MNEGDPGAKTSVVVGESGTLYTNVAVEDQTLGTVDKLVDDHEPQPATLAEGE